MRTFQDSLLSFLQKENSFDLDFENLIKLLDDLQIRQNQADLKSILHLLLKISNAFNPNFTIIFKIGQILINLKKEIKRFYSNDEIFIIFQKSKKILYFLIENNILTVDKFIASRMINNCWFKQRYYPEFFFQEIKPFLNQNQIDVILKKLPKDFIEKRKNGENDDFICQIIREDSIQEFKQLQTNGKIKDLNDSVAQSIFETNLFLLKSNSTLIQYAAFYGSFQIFDYLLKNKVRKDSSLILYAIHGENQKIIQSLQKIYVYKYLSYDKFKYKKILKKSIKCHYNDITEYFFDSIDLQNDEKSNIVNDYSLKYYNFYFIKESFITKDKFNKLCKYDYFYLVSFFF